MRYDNSQMIDIARKCQYIAEEGKTVPFEIILYRFHYPE